MKKVFLSFVFILFAVVSFAQVKSFTDADTVTNAGADTLNLTLKEYCDNIAIQVFITKVSGTVAGSAKLYGSLDGSNFYSISSDTLAVADVANQSFIWNEAPAKYVYYRIIVNGSGTMVAIPSAKALCRKD